MAPLKIASGSGTRANARFTRRWLCVPATRPGRPTCVPISKFAESVLETRRDADVHPRGAARGHAGDGNFHLVFVPGDNAADLARRLRSTAASCIVPRPWAHAHGRTWGRDREDGLSAREHGAALGHEDNQTRTDLENLMNPACLSSDDGTVVRPVARERRITLFDLSDTSIRRRACRPADSVIPSRARSGADPASQLRAFVITSRARRARRVEAGSSRILYTMAAEPDS